LSRWTNSYLIAGVRLEVISSVGDPSDYLPRAMGDFLSPGLPNVSIELGEDETAQADPLKLYFPPQFSLTARGDGLAFEGKAVKGSPIGIISPDCRVARMGSPFLDRQWRIPEEREAFQEALHGFIKACLQCRLMRDGGTLLHAAGIEYEGDGYAFAGHTRAGKTTLARAFPVPAVIGDDLVAVGEEHGGYRLFGTPWPGREGGIVSYGGVSIKAVFNLHPELPPGLHVQTQAEAVAELASNAPRLGYIGEESKLLEIFSSLASTVPILMMSLQLHDDVIAILEEFSSGR
jgi:hypothetical protein